MAKVVAVIGASSDRRKFGNRALRATMDMFGVRWLLSRRLNYKINEKI